ncbi:MAG: histidine phosphatase family protein [Coriobacteriia bacterium]|nr:histidine phosphatase family protein [Coriobacteriia bacterium]
MRLYLLRHAPAVSRTEWAGPDAARPLSPDGEAVARSVAERIDSLGLGLSAVITSPYERALQTARIVCDAMKDPVPLVEDVRLEPHQFTPEALADILAEYPEDASIMVVGHEPSMTEVIASVLQGGRFVLKKAGLARIDLDGRSTQTGVLKWFVPPRLL